MIFVTVGTQLPFDRLVKAVDSWALGQGVRDIFAQIGCSEYTPKNIDFKINLTAAEYEKIIDGCSLIISHAGIGTILSAIDNDLPIIVSPRLMEFGEHRNNHQVATANKLCTRLNIPVWDCSSDLSKLVSTKRIVPSNNNVISMIENLREILDGI